MLVPQVKKGELLMKKRKTIVEELALSFVACVVFLVGIHNYTSYLQGL